MNESKWVLRSRQLWQWAFAILTIITALDAVTVDLILPHIINVLGLDPGLLPVIRAKVLSVVSLSVLGLALWRKAHPDDRTLTILPNIKK